uniref:Iron-sulfur cluster assembly factor IBA57, mitochondrial n=1 Tax=Anolis carolinensis TaxID=28377 RepID=G1KFU2_ANOCA|nr:PREDICTED: putative transferase CAF17, mitochondrial isoform X1 [Anolis carolinensis]|eukprot:XP_008110448.2 PREDICTED: putative transferase CAF17, mitochondrial isoform X1 [Anolis carolinensis]
MLVRANAALRRALSLRLGLRGGDRKLSGEGGDSQAVTTCFPLEHRALLRLRGPEAATFLQGLLTNDVTLLTQQGGGDSQASPRALYAHALNVQGRCLYDVILYRIHRNSQEEPHLLLECDAAALDPLQKHLKLYKIRRKVDITSCLDLCLWAVLPEGPSEEASQKLQQYDSKAVVATLDPRVDIMGWRLVASRGADPLEIIPGSQIGNVKDYHMYRYRQGIPEGVRDLPSGVALPLESNVAYLNGISFTKGCYIGQELTARTHHMGVIRKRLLPIRFTSPLPPESLPKGLK